VDYFYSPSTKGFYVEVIHGKAGIPKDAVKVSEEEHQRLIDGQSAELEIVPDLSRKGFPILRARKGQGDAP
jgi:hypothetical protein